MDVSNFFESKFQVLELIKRADDTVETRKIIEKLKAIKLERKPFFLTLAELEEILIWKLRGQFKRQIKVRELNTPENIKQITQTAFSIKHTDSNYEIELRLKLLTTINGIGIPVASAILTLCFPELYAVIDYRNWRKIYGDNFQKTNYSIKEYIDYLKVVRQIAANYDLTPQEIDMAIWQLDIDEKK